MRLSFAVFRTACLIILLMGIALQFPSIQSFCINNFLLKDKQAIKIEGFSGLFPFYFSCEKINLHDEDRPLLTIKNLDINWSAWNFITQKIIAIEKLHIDSIEYHEIFSPNTAQETLTFPKIPLGYISNLKINEAIYITAKQTFKYKLNGNTQYVDNGFAFNLMLSNLKEKAGVLNAWVKYAKGISVTEDHLDLNLTAEEKQGLLHYLTPNLKGRLKLSLHGSGTLSNFKGKMSTTLGEASFSSELQTNLDADKKNISLFSNCEYKEKNKTYNLSGLIKTTSSLTQFMLRDWVLMQNNHPYIKLSGDIQRKRDSFKSNNLTIVTSLSPTHTLHTTGKFEYNPYHFVLNGEFKNRLLANKDEIAFINIPISAKGTLDSLRILLEGKGMIPNLPAAYEKYSKFDLKAELEPKSILTTPKITLTLTTLAGKVNALFTIDESLRLSLKGDLLSNFFQMDLYKKNNKWYLSGKNQAPKEQPWTISGITTTITPNKDLQFEGKVNLNVHNKNIATEFTGRIDNSFEKLNLVSLRANYQETFFESSGAIDLSKEEGALNWHFYTFNLKDFLSPNDTAAGTLSLLGQINIAPQNWLLSFAGEFHKLFLGNISATSGTLSGSIPLNNKRDLEVSLNAKKSSAYGTIIEELELNTQGTIDQFSTTLKMNGYNDQALKGNLAFSISSLSALEIEAFSIQLGQHEILLSHPTTLLYTTAQGLKLDPLELNIDKGNLKVTGNATPEMLSLKASLNNIPSQLIYNLTHGSFFLKGLLNGTVQAYGQMTAPTLKLDLTTSDPLYKSSISGTIQDGALKTLINLENNELSLNLEGIYPLDFSLAPFRFNLEHSKPFNTNLVAKGLLDKAQEIFDLNYDKLLGKIDAKVFLNGTIDNPTSKGYINIFDGAYERQNIGLKLSNLNLSFNARRGYFVLNGPVKFQDHHGNAGNIIFAHLGIGKFLIPNLDTEITFDKIQFIDLPETRRGGMSAFGSGTLKAKGPTNALAIYLRGEISSLEKYIGETEEIPIYHTNTIHHNSPLKSLQASDEDSGSPTTYDIDLSLERKFHIFGQGLNSKWKGRLVIQGTSSAPIYKGQFVLREGELRILDRFFDVQKGEIFFDGDLSPKLYIESELQLQDMRVKIILEGDATNLQKRFVSDKNLSEAEILQKLFFNRTSTISQSFQALNYLASSSFISSFLNIGFYQQEDPIKHTQKEFISVHKKFSKRTYGKVDFGINTGSESDRVSLAAGFQPTPKTKTEVTFSPQKNSVGIELEWSHDF